MFMIYYIFLYHIELDELNKAVKKLNKISINFVHSIQAISISRVNISSKHIEIIVRQMTSKM